MGKWTIYRKNGDVVAVTGILDAGKFVLPELSYSGTWMGERFVTVSVKSPYPIDWQIGDYLIYRGETFVLNYDPTVVKKSRKGTSGEGFVYDGVKFNSLSYECGDVRFLDEVLQDSHIHYTSLSTFTFFSATADDLADRLQANMNRYCSANGFSVSDWWLILTPSLERSRARALASGGSALAEEAVSRWNEFYTDGVSVDGERFNQNVSVSDISVLDGFALLYNLFGLHFITSGRTLAAGTSGKIAEHVFEYGKGKGLYELEKVADGNQAIATKLFAYGNSTNLPVRYYARLNKTCFAKVRSVETGGTSFVIDIPFASSYYNGSKNPSVSLDSFQVTFLYGGTQYTCYVASDRGYPVSKQEGYSYLNTFGGSIPSLSVGDTITFVSGIDDDKWPSGHFSYVNDGSVLPDNLAISHLMLPGFPSESLRSWVLKNGGVEKGERLIAWRGYEAYFSEDPLSPYVQSANAKKLGVRESSLVFNGSNGTDDIHPTITGSGKDVVVRCDMIADNGIFGEGEEVPNFHLVIPSLGEDVSLDILLRSDAKISMKDGYCGGMEFNIESVNIVEDGWELTLNRAYDDDLQLYFPYSFGASLGNEPSSSESYQIRKGDTFVLLGIELPSSYIGMASERLLEGALQYLSGNDYTRHTYVPRVDEIYMARQHDAVVRGVDELQYGTVSLHDTLREGDLMRFEDADLSVGGTIFIDQLQIKEYGNKQIPTYDVTLRESKSVGTIERIQQEIDALSQNKSGGGGGGVSTSQVKSILNMYGDKRYIRRDIDDETDTILGAKQFVAKEKVVADRIKSKTEDAPVVVENDLSVEGNSSVKGDMNVEGKATVEGAASISGNATLKGGSNKIYGDVTFGKDGTDSEYVQGVKGAKIYFTNGGWHIDTDYLAVNKRMYAKSIQVDEVDHVGGQIILTEASCVADKVADTEEYYRVYFRAKDGEGRKVYNQWHVGDQAYCQIFNIDKGVTEDFSNRYYWRLVVGIGSGDEFHYIDLSKSVYDISGDLKMDNDAGTTPMPDDPIVQLGYRRQSGDDDEFVKQRQGATMISGGGRQGRSIRMWEKIDSFILPEPRVLISPSNVEMTLNKLHIKTTGDDEEAKDVIDYVQEYQEQFHIFELDTSEIPTLENEPYITWTEKEKVRYSTPPNNAVVINADGRTWRFIVTDGVYSFEEFTDPWLLAQHKDLQTILDDNVIAADELITLIRLKTELEKESVEVESEKNAAKVDVTAAYNEWKIAFDLLKEVLDDLTAMNPPILLDGYKGELNGVSSPHSREELSGAFNNHTVALYKWQAALRDAGLDKVEGEIEQAAQDIYNIMSDNVVTADEVNRIKTIAQEMQAQYNEAVAQRNTLDEARFAKVESVYNALVDAYNAIEKVMQGLIAADTPIQLPVTIEDVSYTRDNINSLYADYAKSIYEWQSVYQKIFSDEALDDISRIFDDNIITADELKEINKAKAEIDEEKANVDAEYNELGDKQDALDAFYQNYVNAYNALGNLFAVILSTSTPIQLKTENEDGDIQYTREEINLLFADYASALIGWQSAVPKKFVSDVQEELDDILDDNVITEDEVSRIITIKGEVVSEYAIAVSQKATLSDKQYDKVSETFDSMEEAYNALIVMFDAILAAETPIHLGTEEFSYTREGINTLYSNYAAGIYEWQSAYQKLFSDEALSDISKILDDSVITADEMLVFARLNNTLSSEKSSVTSQYNDAVAKAVIDTAPLTSAYNNYITAVDGLMATLTGLINLDTPVYLKDYTGEKEGGSSTDVGRADIEEIITFHSSAYQKWVHDVADFNNEGNSALLEEILSDNIISANEKPTFIEMGKRIAQESVQERNKYQAVTSPSTALTTAYTNYTSAMTTLMTVLANIKNLTPPIHLKTDTEAGDIAYTRDGLQSLVVTYDVRLAAWRDAYEDFRRDKSSIDTLQDAKDYTNGEIDKILETTSKEYIDGLIKDFTEGKFVSNSDFIATNERLTAVYNWAGEDKNSFSSSGLQATLDDMFVGTSSVEFDENNKIINFSKAGLVTTTNFASVFAEETGKDGETVSAIISAFVKDETSNIVITAENVFIESGSPALSNYFKVEYGNVTMQDLYCRNITVEGVINNLINELSTADSVIWKKYGSYCPNSDPPTFYLDPLKCGSVIKITSDSNIGKIILPTAHHDDVDNTVIEGSVAGYEYYIENELNHHRLNALRQCIGKKIWILNEQGGAGLLIQSGGTSDEEGTSLLMAKQYVYNGNSYGILDLADLPTGMTAVTEEMEMMSCSNDSTHGAFYNYLIECKMGMFNSRECVYWELTGLMPKLEDDA